MAIVALPPELGIDLRLTCAICAVALTLDRATAGPYDAGNRQAFACVSHFLEVERLIVGWADFAAKERYKYLHDGQELGDVLRQNGGRHA